MLRLSKVTTTIVMTLATIAFVGLAFLQIKNLRSSLDTNKKIFLQKVDLASSAIALSFSQNTENPYILSEAATRVRESDQINDNKIDQLLKNLIDPVLKDHGIETPYEYAVYIHNDSKEGFSFVLGDDGASLDFELTSCVNPDERGHGWANLTCSQGLGVRDYHLALFFPDQDDFVFAQSEDALVLSILFILLLIFCFSYTLLIIHRQKKLSEIKNDFINNLTHEFKTPLASISLSNHVLQDTSINRTDRQSYYDIIDLETKRLQSHIDKILQIAQLDSGNFNLEAREVDLNELIENVVVSFNPLIKKKELNIKLKLQEGAIVLGDPDHLSNVLYNLLDNAIKYASSTPTIEILTESSNGAIILIVSDNGIGMDKKIQQHAFEKFYRGTTGNIHNIKGFGLGLNYVKNIIEAHKGLISLSSTPNKGTSFSIQLPAL